MNLNLPNKETDEYNLEINWKKDLNFFDFCSICPSYQNNVKDWMKHLVDRHPVPTKWMSDAADNLIGDKVNKPYTYVTESRKKRKSHVIPRPLNSFMIFSRHLRRNILMKFNDASNSEISKHLGKLWNNISSPIKSLYDAEAKKLAILHSKEFPDYKYQPKKKKKHYSNKRNEENCTPLSNNSYESLTDDMTCSIPNVPKSISLKKESNSRPLSSFESIQETKSNFFIRNNSNYDYSYPKNTRKANRKVSKQSKHITSNPVTDDSEGAESSPSSFQNIIKNDMFTIHSPFVKETSHSLSDIIGSPISTFFELNNNITSANHAKQQSDLPDFEINSQNIIGSYKQLFQKNTNLSINLTTPLTIVTDKIDDFAYLHSPKINSHLIKMIPKSDIFKDTVFLQEPTHKPLNGQQILDFSNLEGLIRETQSNLDSGLNSEIVEKCISDFVNNYNNYNPVKLNVINEKHANKDPLLNEDMFENEYFEDDVVSCDNFDNNNGSPWSFKSPSLKVSADSSTLSDNPCKETLYASSPFHLSEGENSQGSIQRLPAIGSWLKSNYSEFMI